MTSHLSELSLEELQAMEQGILSAPERKEVEFAILAAKESAAQPEGDVEAVEPESVVLTEADAQADLDGEPRPDHPTVEAEDAEK